MHTGSKATDKRCPFCSGHEADTPPELDAVRADGTAKDTPGWSVRAFDNLYPATPRHEVIAEGPAHAEHPSDLDAATLADAVSVWQRRITALESSPDIACAYWFKNVGARRPLSEEERQYTQELGVEPVKMRWVFADKNERLRAPKPSLPPTANARLVGRGAERLAAKGAHGAGASTCTAPT